MNVNIYLPIEWNLIRLDGLVHGIVRNTVHKIVRGLGHGSVQGGWVNSGV